MIVTSKTEHLRWTMFDFLKDRKVLLSRSEDFQAIGRLGVEGRLIGVVGYFGFAGLTCQICDAGEGNWVSRELIRATFDYPFRQLGMEHLFATVRATNARALRLDRRIGFADFARVKDGWARGEDMIILTMARDDCRWLTQDAERIAA